MNLNLPMISPTVKSPNTSAEMIPSDASFLVFISLIWLRIPPMLIELALFLAVLKKVVGFRAMCANDVK